MGRFYLLRQGGRAERQINSMQDARTTSTSIAFRTRGTSKAPAFCRAFLKVIQTPYLRIASPAPCAISTPADAPRRRPSRGGQSPSDRPPASGRRPSRSWRRWSRWYFHPKNLYRNRIYSGSPSRNVDGCIVIRVG